MLRPFRVMPQHSLDGTIFLSGAGEVTGAVMSASFTIRRTPWDSYVEGLAAGQH